MIDVSGWVSDWLSHFVLSGTGALAAYLLTQIISLQLLRIVAGQLPSGNYWPARQAGRIIGLLSSSAAAFSALLLHCMQDYYWGPLFNVTVRIPLW